MKELWNFEIENKIDPYLQHIEFKYQYFNTKGLQIDLFTIEEKNLRQNNIRTGENKNKMHDRGLLLFLTASGVGGTFLAHVRGGIKKGYTTHTHNKQKSLYLS